jgi:hypothetical protein
MLTPPKPPKDETKRPGLGFFMTVALLAAIAAAVVWALTTR